MEDSQVAALTARLATIEGEALLREAAALSADTLTRLTALRRHHDAEIAAAAVELLELRKRARAKFSHSETMFFTREGLEQATGERAAAYHASRFPADTPVLDLCCGIGGDASELAARGAVIAVDRGAAAAVCTRLNTVGRGDVSVLQADVTSLDLNRFRRAGVTRALFDPSRRVTTRAGGRARAARPEDYSPPLDWVRELRIAIPDVGLKASPTTDDDLLIDLDACVEFISDNGECKEAMLWYGGLDTGDRNGRYRAVVLRSGSLPQVMQSIDVPPAPVGSPAGWLYEPDPAVIRAHLTPQVADVIGAHQMDSGIAYLTGDSPVQSPFVTAYRILESMPYNLKHVGAALRRLGRRAAVVKKRAVSYEPDAVRAALRKFSSADCPDAIIVLTRVDNRPHVLICAPPGEL